MGDAQKQDCEFMNQALALAALGAGRTAPNPMVGCVLVRDGLVIGEGWHKGAGLAHAEVEAIADVGPGASAKDAGAKGASAYVTLEPCNHTGRTGPCAEALIAAGVTRVIYALADPTLEAKGGAARLRDAGVAVTGGVCEAAAREQNRFWLHRMETGRPYIIAKFAASLDGKIAAGAGDSKWITGPQARRRAHDLRRQCDAILVGANTVITDDPSLTARGDEGETTYPLRIVLDSTARTPPGAKVYDRTGKGALLATTNAAPAANIAAIEGHGVDIFCSDSGADGKPDLDALLSHLGERGLNAVMAEGGGAVLGALFDAGLVDEVWAFIAPVIIGGDAISAVGGVGASHIENALRLTGGDVEYLGGDILVRGKTSGGTL